MKSKTQIFDGPWELVLEEDRKNRSVWEFRDLGEGTVVLLSSRNVFKPVLTAGSVLYILLRVV